MNNSENNKYKPRSLRLRKLFPYRNTERDLELNSRERRFIKNDNTSRINDRLNV